MAVAKRIKEQSELMEKRLKDLKEAMVKEKEERRRFMETKWKSARLLKKTTSQPQLRENKITPTNEISKQQDKSKKVKRKQENCNLNTETTEKVHLGLEITGSTLHSRFTPSTFKQTMVRGQRTNSCIPVGPDSLQTESVLNRRSINEDVACLSAAFEAPISSVFDGEFDEVKSSEDFKAPISSVFDGEFDEVKNSEDFEKAVTAWREGKSSPVKVKMDCADKETNPLDSCLKKYDLTILTELYQLALVNESKQSNENENNDDIINYNEILDAMNENEKAKITGNDGNENDPSTVFTSDENEGLDEFSMMNQIENIEPEFIDFENMRLVAASTGLRETSRFQTNSAVNVIKRNSIQVSEIETAPFKPIEEGPKWISPQENTENTKMFARFDDVTRLSSRPRFTVSPMFDDNSLLPLRLISRDLRSRSSSSLNDEIEFHVRSLSRASDEGEQLQVLDDVKCEDFGIRDFLNASGSKDGDAIDYMGALETKFDCHLVDIISNSPPPMDDVRTPTPTSNVDLDGFPDECIQRDFDLEEEEEKNQEQLENTKIIPTSGESERSESEVSLNFTKARADSIGDPDQIAAEILETNLLFTQIDNAEEELDCGDRFDDQAAVASLD